mmetsp:Transcript_90181/g.215387  ORF Transcript_90181/g.215387 Transcript_90181/m.215387 type:complete len:228 (+) Transcript_90181:308-991(+)
MRTHRAAVPSSLQAVKERQVETAVVGEAQGVPNCGEQPRVDDLSHRQQACGRIKRMILELRVGCVPGELLFGHDLLVVVVAKTPAVGCPTADVRHSALIAVLQMGSTLPIFRRQLLSLVDLRRPVQVDLLRITGRQQAEVLPQSLVQLLEPPLLRRFGQLNLLQVGLTFLAMLSGAEAALDTCHLAVPSALKVGHQIDFQVLWSQLPAHSSSHLRQSELVQGFHLGF